MAELSVGDFVYAIDGKPTEVLAKYNPQVKKAYKIIFDDNSEIVCCNEHLWEVYITKGEETKVVDTDELASIETARYVPLSKPLIGEKQDLPLHPYYLGLWLGDGGATTSNITCSEVDYPDHVRMIESCGYITRVYDSKPNTDITTKRIYVGLPEDNTERTTHKNCSEVGEFTKEAVEKGNPEKLAIYGDWAKKKGIKMTIIGKLREANLYGNKHIPEAYFQAPENDRWELLKGMMDSDGYSSKIGCMEYCSVNKRLAEDFLHLCRSLGIHSKMTVGDATLNGKFISKKYRVFLRSLNPCFTLERKLKNQFSKKYSKVATTNRLYKKVVSVEEVSPEGEFYCITVDHPRKLFLAGEELTATHNTFTGAKWVRQAVEIHGARRLMLSAPTLGDIKKVMLDGESGLMAMYPEGHPNKPIYYPSYGEVRFPKTKSVAILVPYESMERARGPQQSHVWIDEPASMGANALEFVENILMGTRLYPAQVLITGTPKPTPLMLDLVEREGKDVNIIRGSTYENAANLDERMIKRAKMMENTPLGRQEIHAELALTNPAALWSPDLIESSMVSEMQYPPKMWARVAIGIDPSANKAKSDLTGICVAVQITDGSVVVWRDCSGTYTSEGWTKLVSDLFDEFSNYAPTVVVIEQNGVGATWQDILNKHRSDIPVKQFQTTKNKYSRIGQTSYMFEVGTVKMNKDSDFIAMHKEMQTYTGGTKEKSPDHVEAMCFAVNELLYKKQNVTMAKEMIF